MSEKLQIELDGSEIVRGANEAVMALVQLKAEIQRLASAVPSGQLKAQIQGVATSAVGVVDAVSKTMSSVSVEVAKGIKRAEVEARGGGRRVAKAMAEGMKEGDAALVNTVRAQRQRLQAEYEQTVAAGAKVKVQALENLRAMGVQLFMEDRKRLQNHRAANQDFQKLYLADLDARRDKLKAEIRSEMEAAEKIRAIRLANVAGSARSQVTTAMSSAGVYSSLVGAKFGTTVDPNSIDAAKKKARELADEHRNLATRSNEVHSALRGISAAGGALFLTYGSLVPLVASFFAAQTVRQAITDYKDFEFQLKFVQAVANDTSVSLGKMMQSVAASAKEVGAAPVEAAKGMRILAQAGLSSTEALETLPSILRLSVVGELDMAAAAEAATGAVNAFGIGVENVNRVVDVFFKSAAVSNTSVRAIAESMKQASTIAQRYRVDVEDVGVALVALAKRNITGSAAGTAITQMFEELATPRGEGRKVASALGITLFDPIKHDTKQFFEKFVPELRKKLEQFDPESQTFILNRLTNNRGAKALSAILGLSDADLAELKAKLNDATGAAARAVIELNDSVQGDLNKLKAAFTETLIGAGAGGSDALRSSIQELNAVVSSDATQDSLTGLVKTFSTIVQMAAMAVNGWSMVFSIVQDFGGVLAFLINPLGSVKKLLQDIGVLQSDPKPGELSVASIEREIKKEEEYQRSLQASIDKLRQKQGLQAVANQNALLDAQARVASAQSAYDEALNRSSLAGTPGRGNSNAINADHSLTNAKKELDDALVSYNKLVDADTRRLRVMQETRNQQEELNRLQRQAAEANRPDRPSGTKHFNLDDEKAADKAAAKAAKDAEKERIALVKDRRKWVIEATEDYLAGLAAEKKAIEDAEKAWSDMAVARQDRDRETLVAINDRITAIQEETTSYGRLQSEIEATKLAVLEEQRELAAFAGDNVAAINARIDAQKRLVDALKGREVADAHHKVTEQAKNEWDQVAQSMTDALMEGGQSVAEYLRDLFRTLVLRPIIAPVGQSMAGVLGGGGGGVVSGASPTGVGGIANFNSYGMVGAGLQALTGASVGASAASLGIGNAVGAFGGDALGAMIAANGSWAGVSAGAAGAAGGAGLAGTVAAAIPVIGWAVAIASVLYSVFGQDPGGPKTEGFFNPYNKTPFFSGPNAQSNEASQTAAEALQTQFDSLTKAIGATSRLKFGLGFSADPQGDAPTMLRIGAGQDGKEAFNFYRDDVGREEADLQKAIAEMSSRAILQGLQQANLQGLLGDYLAQLGDVAELTASKLDKAITKVTKAINEHVAIEGRYANLVLDAQAQLTLARERELEALDESNRAAMQKVHALEDEKRAQMEALSVLEQSKELFTEANGFLGGLKLDIQGYLDQLAAGPTGLGSPQSQLSAARSAYNRQLKLARGGDRDALESITQYADTFIQAQTNFTASGTATQGVIGRVRKDLAGLPDQVSAEELVANAVKEGAQVVKLSVQQLGTLIETQFGDMDKNLDGIVDLTELKSYFGPLATDAQLRALMRSQDKNEDGVISKLEAIGVAESTNSKALNKQLMDHLAKEFRRVDTDLSNALNAGEIVRYLGISAGRAASLVKIADADKDGSLSWLEIINSSINLNSIEERKVAQAVGKKQEEVTKTAYQLFLERMGGSIPTGGADETAAPWWWPGFTDAGFADGGFHAGGFRLVGEGGMELEATGPSRIFSHEETRRIFSASTGDSELRREVVALRQEMQRLVAVTAAGFRGTIDGVHGVEQNTAASMRAAELRAAEAPV